MRKQISILLIAALMVGCSGNRQEGRVGRQGADEPADSMEAVSLPEGETGESGPAPETWQQGVEQLGSRYSVLGIWRMKDIGTTLTIYERDGKFWLNTCQMQSPIVSLGQEQPLEKQDDYTYIHREEGSDMPEKYVIQDRTMQSFVQHPQSGKWSPLATYHAVWQPKK